MVGSDLFGTGWVSSTRIRSSRTGLDRIGSTWFDSERIGWARTGPSFGRAAAASPAPLDPALPPPSPPFRFARQPHHVMWRSVASDSATSRAVADVASALGLRRYEASRHGDDLNYRPIQNPTTGMESVYALLSLVQVLGECDHGIRCGRRGDLILLLVRYSRTLTLLAR